MMGKFSLRIIFVLIAAIVSGHSASAVTIEEIADARALADSLHGAGLTDSAAVVGRHAIELALESGDPTQIVGTNSAQGVFLRSLGRIDEALDCYGKALEIVTSGEFRENPSREDVEEIATLYINLAILNLDMAHKEEAVKDAELAAEWITKSDDPDWKSMAYFGVGSVMANCGMFDKAVDYHSEAYRNAVDSGNEESAFRSSVYVMLINDRLGDKAESQLWRDRCLSMLPGIDATMTVLIYYQAECSICLQKNDLRGAIGYFDKILGLEGIDDLPFVKFDCYNNMHIAYSGIGDYEKAYETLLKGNELRDSIWEKEKSESLRDLTVKYETKETELALARSEARRSEMLMWLFALLALLLAAAVGFVVYVARQRRARMEREVEFANLRSDIGRKLTEQYVEGLETERERMAKELHDGVCNDILAIRMNIDRGISTDESVRLLDSCREAAGRISHELMPPEFAYANLDEVVRYYVVKQNEACGGRAVVRYLSETDSDWGGVADSMALEIYRIVQESVGNALKHSGATEVDVRMELKDSRLSLTVENNGRWTPSGRKGIGLASMKRRAASIAGSLTIETEENDSVRMTLTVNLNK